MNRNIVVINRDGTRETHLTNDKDYSYSPTWSPDGTRIAFVSDRDASYRDATGAWGRTSCCRELYVVHADGSNPTRLTTGASVHDILSWPSGRIGTE